MYRADPKVLEDLATQLTEMSIDAYEITSHAAQGMAKTIPGAKYDMFDGMSQEEIDWVEGQGPDVG